MLLIGNKLVNRSNFSKYNSMIRKDFEPKIEDGKVVKLFI